MEILYQASLGQTFTFQTAKIGSPTFYFKKDVQYSVKHAHVLAWMKKKKSSTISTFDKLQTATCKSLVKCKVQIMTGG